jgi:hypothetical protein
MIETKHVYDLTLSNIGDLPTQKTTPYDVTLNLVPKHDAVGL